MRHAGTPKFQLSSPRLRMGTRMWVVLLFIPCTVVEGCMNLSGNEDPRYVVAFLVYFCVCCVTVFRMFTNMQDPGYEVGP